MPQDVIVPGILETADVADIVAALAPQPVLLEGLVDGRNHRLTTAKVAAQLQTAALGGPVLLPEEAAEPGLAAWTGGQLHPGAIRCPSRSDDGALPRITSLWVAAGRQSHTTAGLPLAITEWDNQLIPGSSEPLVRWSGWKQRRRAAGRGR
jgi:hypothetical protein